MNKIEEIKKYIESLKDDGDIYYLDNEAESLLFRALEIIEEKDSQLSEARDLLSDASSMLDDVHCGDTKVCIAIDNFLYGEDK